jgi:glyoxylase-like metal-dependent hydrolase (beta-lactamase superfamily II)
MNDAAINDSCSHIDLVKLDIPLEGFYNFIGCWIYYAGNQITLVDPGPRNTIAALMYALRERGIKKIDYILLTHIHIDHAGGAGLLLQYYPSAQVICHPVGPRQNQSYKKALLHNS